MVCLARKARRPQPCVSVSCATAGDADCADDNALRAALAAIAITQIATSLWHDSDDDTDTITGKYYLNSNKIPKHSKIVNYTSIIKTTKIPESAEHERFSAQETNESRNRRMCMTTACIVNDKNMLVFCCLSYTRPRRIGLLHSPRGFRHCVRGFRHCYRGLRRALFITL